MSQRPRAQKKPSQTRKTNSSNSARLSSSSNLPLPISAPTLKLSEGESTDTNETTSSQTPDLESLLQMNGTSTSVESEASTNKRRDRFDKLQGDIQDQFTGLGVMLFMVNQADGKVILEHAQTLSTRLTAVAKQNPTVYKVLKRYLEGSVYTALTLEVAVIVQAIMKNHGIDPIERIKNRFQPAAEETSANGHVPGLHHALSA